MKVGIAYTLVVLIWSTTPLAIKWSSSSVSFSFAITARVVGGLLILLALLAALRRPLVAKRSDWLAFFAGSIGIFPNMLIVYWSAQFIPSALVAVIFGVYPFMIGLFSLLLLKENIFSTARVFAIAIAVAGLVVINAGQLNLGSNALLGVAGILCSTVLFALSSVWLKAIGGGIDSLRQSTGILLVSAPPMIIFWLLSDGRLPTTIDAHSLFGVSYLVLAGTVLGGTLFFYVLNHCTVASVGLITFLSPMMAIVIGLLLNDEQVSAQTALGCAMILLSLGIYQNVFRSLARVALSKWRRANGAAAPVDPVVGHTVIGK